MQNVCEERGGLSAGPAWSACNHVHSRCPQECPLVSGCPHVPMLGNGTCLHACASTALYVHAFTHTHRHVRLHMREAEPRPHPQNGAPEVCRALGGGPSCSEALGGMGSQCTHSAVRSASHLVSRAAGAAGPGPWLLAFSLQSGCQKFCWSHLEGMSLPTSTCSSLHYLGLWLSDSFSFLPSASSLGRFLFILYFCDF